jgi:hypothetical protein
MRTAEAIRLAERMLIAIVECGKTGKMSCNIGGEGSEV